MVFDPAVVSYEAILKVFWEGHDPTQGMRQGNDAGTQYRSGIYWYSDPAAGRSPRPRATPTNSGWARPDTATITTEIVEAPDVLLRRGLPPAVPGEGPNGYCGLGGTGVTCPVGVIAAD